MRQSVSARTTVSASSRPRRVNTARPRIAATPSSRPSATRPATATRRAVGTAARSSPSRSRTPSRTRSSATSSGSRSFPGGGGRPRLAEPVRVRPGMLDVPPADGARSRAHVRVRARPEAPPVRPAPVAEVVSALRSRPRPVAHLVPLEARIAQRRVRDLVLRGLVVGVDGGEDAAAHLRGHARPVLDHEGVRGDVVHAALQGGVQGPAPVVHGLPRRAVDQVQRDVEADLPGPPDDVGHARRVVGALEGRQDVRHGRLHAEGHPREPRSRERGERRRGHGVGVRLGRHLSARGEAPGVPDGVEHPREVARGQERRRPATHEHRVHDASAAPDVVQHPAREADLAQHGRGVRRLVGAPAELGGRVGGEVAVAAAHAAERHVQVDAEPMGPVLARHPGRQSAVVGHRLAVREGGRHCCGTARRDRDMPPIVASGKRSPGKR